MDNLPNWYSRRMKNNLREYRLSRQLTQAALADLVGTSQAQIRRLEAGDRKLTMEWARRIAPHLSVEPANLMYDKDEIAKAELSYVPFNPSTTPQHLPIVGYVEAGAFQSPAERDQSEPVYTLFPADGRYPGIERFCLEVRGNSMNQLYPQGSIVLCISMIQSELEPKEGAVYVVDRIIHGEYESTLKQLKYSNGKKYLWPRSDDPAYQQPIELNGNDGDEIVLRALVIGAYVVQ